MISKRLPFLFLVAALVGLIAYLQWPTEQAAKQKRARVVSVKVTAAKVDEFTSTIAALGTSLANERVLITSSSSDIVEQVSFEDGQMVSKGDLLVRLNNQEEIAKVRELEANLAESVAQLNRFQDLYKKKATSISQVDEQEAKTKAISAQLLSARTVVQELSITAPFSGVLGFREVSVGSYVKAGDVITSLDDLSSVKVDFSVAERYLTALKIGMSVKVESAAYPEEIFVGKITSIDSRIDPVTRMVKVRANIPNQELKLRAGMLMSIVVEQKVENLLQLPESAIIPIEDRHYVFVNAENVAKRKQISIGKRLPGKVEITDGLVAGEQVVIEGALKLRDGSAINILEQ